MLTKVRLDCSTPPSPPLPHLPARPAASADSSSLHPAYLPTTLSHLQPYPAFPAPPAFRTDMYYSNMAYSFLHHLFDVLSPRCKLVESVRARVLDRIGMGDTFYDHRAAATTGRRADNYVQWGRDPTTCANAPWGTDHSGELVPPRSCVGEVRATGWFLDPGDDGLHLAGWAGVVTSANDLVSATKGHHTSKQGSPSSHALATHHTDAVSRDDPSRAI